MTVATARAQLARVIRHLHLPEDSFSIRNRHLVSENGDMDIPVRKLIAIIPAHGTVMDIALEHGLGSISFCCISTGVYGYPLQEASEIAFNTIRTWMDGHPQADIQVFFCCFTSEEYKTYKQLESVLETTSK